MSKRITEGKAGKIIYSIEQQSAAWGGKKKKRKKETRKNPSVNQDISVHIQPGYVPSLKYNYDFCE